MPFKDEHEPLIINSTSSASTAMEIPQSYDAIAAKIRDEEDSDSHSDTTVEEVDPEYLIKHRLGEVSLSWIVLCLCIGGFLSSVDTSIVITIFNEIGTEFESSNLSVWIMTSYILSTSVVQPLYGKLSDIFGRKSTLVTIVIFFLVGSWLCGAARTMLEMSIARAIAGLGGGGIMTMASIVIHDLVPMRSRGQYQSYVNMAQTIGTTIGAPLGGIINDTLGWRYCFYINIPFCFFLLHTYIYKMENYNLPENSTVNRQEQLSKIDFMGATLLLIANVSFVAGASLGGNTHAWNHPLIVSLFTVAIVFFVLFGVYEWLWAVYPLVSRNLSRNRNVVAVCFNNFFLTATTMTFTYLTPQYFMGVLGYNASSAGLWVLPRTLMVAVGCWLAGRYLGLTGRYKHFLTSLMVAHMFAAVGTYFWEIDTPIWGRLMCMNIEGFIFGCVLVATMVALVADITPQETASATSMLFLCRSTGWLTGSTVPSAILQSKFKKYLEKDIKGPEATKIIQFVRTSITQVRTLKPEVQAIVIDALQRAITQAFLFGVVTSICCFLATLCMRDCQLMSKAKKTNNK